MKEIDDVICSDTFSFLILFFLFLILDEQMLC